MDRTWSRWPLVLEVKISSLSCGRGSLFIPELRKRAIWVPELANSSVFVPHRVWTCMLHMGLTYWWHNVTHCRWDSLVTDSKQLLHVDQYCCYRHRWWDCSGGWRRWRYGSGRDHSGRYQCSQCWRSNAGAWGRPACGSGSSSAFIALFILVGPICQMCESYMPG